VQGKKEKNISHGENNITGAFADSLFVVNIFITKFGIAINSGMILIMLIHYTFLERRQTVKILNLN
jgi:hypothetical protein